MALEALNSPSAAPPHRRFDDLDSPAIDSWHKSKRSKRPRSDQSEDEYLAACLVMLARSGGGRYTSSSSASAVAEEENRKIPPPAAAAYRCSVCDKVFPSYQALGGHKASHRVKPTASTAEESNPTAANCISALNPSGRLHECSICHKTFHSGQALGGHKRRHYEGVIGGGGAKSRTTSSNGGGAAARNIDLNLPPSPELQCDEEVESALPRLFE